MNPGILSNKPRDDSAGAIFTRRPCNTRAFTLLEVMIAVSILAIGFVVLFGSQSRSLSHAAEAQFNILAPMLAGTRFAEMTGASADLGSDEGDFGDEYPGYSWKVEREDATFPSLEILEELERPLSRLVLTISLDEENLIYTIIYYDRQPD